MSISINSLDELQRYLWRMMGRTGQQTSEVSAAILTLAGGILWMKDAVLSDNHLGRSATTILAGGEGLIRSRA